MQGQSCLRCPGFAVPGFAVPGFAAIAESGAWRTLVRKAGCDIACMVMRAPCLKPQRSSNQLPLGGSPTVIQAKSRFATSIGTTAHDDT
jgi:hypothetical protein